MQAAAVMKALPQTIRRLQCAVRRADAGRQPTRCARAKLIRSTVSTCNGDVVHGYDMHGGSFTGLTPAALPGTVAVFGLSLEPDWFSIVIDSVCRGRLVPISMALVSTH